MLKLVLACVFLTACGACAGGLSVKQASIEPASMQASIAEPSSAPTEEVLQSIPVPEQAVQKVGLPTYVPPAGTKMIDLKAFDKASVEGFLAKFKELDATEKEIWVRIDSGGGSVFGGQELIHGLEAAEAKVVCIVDWKAYSMAFFTLQSSGCDLRLMSRRASLMAHEPSTESGGNAGTLRDDADLLDALNEGFLVVSAERMGFPIETIRAKTERRTWWMDYRTAEKWNAVDGWAKPQDLPAPTPFEIKKSFMQMLLGG